MPYQIKQEAINLLITGFEQNNNLKEALIKSVDRKRFREENSIIIDKSIAWDVLFSSFNKDPDVINLIKYEFENEERPFISADRHEIFRHLAHHFKGTADLIPPVEKWLDNRWKKYNYIDPEVAFACIFIHSENAKEILLQDLPRTGVSHWNVMALLEGWPEDSNIKEGLKEYFRTIDTNKTSASAHFISKVFDSHEKEEAIKVLKSILFDKKITFRERAIPALIEIDKEYFEKNILNPLLDDLDSFPKDIFSQYYSALEVIVKNFHLNTTVQSYVLERIERDNILYSLSVQHFPELIKYEANLLKKSIPLSKEYRSSIIESFMNLSVLPSNIEAVLSNFEAEAEEEVMADIAVCLFNHIKENNTDKIIELSKPLVFARGFDYEVKRSIAFAGFLIAKKLEEYFSIEDDKNSKDKSKLLEIFSEQSYRKTSSGIMIKSIIDNFDYLISYTGKDFSSLVEHLKYSQDIENIWGFFAKHSVRSSCTYPYLIDFISNHSTTIKNNSIISFLNRTTPKSPILKDILLRIINTSDRGNGVLAGRLLGTNFKNDSQVYEEVKKIKVGQNSGKIIALCIGWPQEPLLKEMFDDIVENQYYVDEYVGFNLKFLFRDVNNLTEFLKSHFTHGGDIERYHKYFFIPMIERLKRDKDFGLAIKALLLSSDSISEKISYYNLLSQANMVDEDVTLWKNKIIDFKHDFGYDIVSNKTVRLKDVLHDYYY